MPYIKHAGESYHGNLNWASLRRYKQLINQCQWQMGKEHRTDQPNEGLGYWICLDENQTLVYKAIMKNMAEMWQKIGAVYLSERGGARCATT